MATFISDTHRTTSTPHPMAFTVVDIKIKLRIQLIKVYLFVEHANKIFTQQLIHLPVQTCVYICIYWLKVIILANYHLFLNIGIFNSSYTCEK